MARSTDPHFEEGDIIELCAPKVFARGQQLFDDDALSETVRQGNELRAFCEGSDLEPYRLSVKLTAQGIGAMSCSCPYEYGGPCKHLVGLLLTWVHTPESFQEEAELLPQLRKRKSDELAQLIVQLVEIEPKLRSFVRQHLGGVNAHGVDEARKKVSSILKTLSRSDWDADFHGARRDIEFFTRQASALESQAPQQAGELFASLLDAMVE